MLTREHAIYEFREGALVPDRLTQTRHAAYKGHAGKMLELYRHGVGKIRGELHRQLERLFDEEEDCHPRRIKSFIKLLDDAATFEVAGAAELPSKLRLKVFAMAGHHHPLVEEKLELNETASADVKERIAMELGRPWPEIEANLFADVLDFQVLTKFRGYESPEHLLSAYNVGQAQSALLKATEMRITASQDLRVIVTGAKLAGLVVKVEWLGEGNHRFTLSGAASDLRTTHRYGADMAKFLPTLIRAKGWSMEADVLLSGNRIIKFRLNSSSGLGTHLPPFKQFDSSVEEVLFNKWGGKVREGWTLARESRVLHQGQTAFFPDFLLKHESGKEVLLEIVGHWTPEYLDHKLRTLSRFADRRFLLAVKEGNLDSFRALGIPMVSYKTSIVLGDLMNSLLAV
jgi:predicted nuclease of restriction endonuclease-like RecB superfamily